MNNTRDGWNKSLKYYVVIDNGVRFVIIRLSYIKAPEHIMTEFHVLNVLIVSCEVDEIIIMGFGTSFI